MSSSGSHLTRHLSIVPDVPKTTRRSMGWIIAKSCRTSVANQLPQRTTRGLTLIRERGWDAAQWHSAGLELAKTLWGKVLVEDVALHSTQPLVLMTAADPGAAGRTKRPRTAGTQQDLPERPQDGIQQRAQNGEKGKIPRRGSKPHLQV